MGWYRGTGAAFHQGHWLRARADKIEAVRFVWSLRPLICPKQRNAIENNKRWPWEARG